MEFALILLFLLIGFFLITIGMVKGSILFGVVGTIIVFILGMVMLNTGIEYPTGSISTSTLNVTSGDMITGNIDTGQVITYKVIKNDTTFLVSFWLVIMSVFIAYFFWGDYKTRRGD